MGCGAGRQTPSASEHRTHRAGRLCRPQPPPPPHSPCVCKNRTPQDRTNTLLLRMACRGLACRTASSHNRAPSQIAPCHVRAAPPQLQASGPSKGGAVGLHNCCSGHCSTRRPGWNAVKQISRGGESWPREGSGRDQGSGIGSIVPQGLFPCFADQASGRGLAAKM